MVWKYLYYLYIFKFKKWLIIIINIYVYQAPLGKVIIITRVEQFVLEANYDFVTIYDGLAQSTNQRFYQMTGNVNIMNPIILTSQKVQITFTRYTNTFFLSSTKYSNL